ncbi:N-acetylglucosaminyl-phosphatidylinositol de-N-acetylase [Rhipicephalus sanguineus]|uniref:N-acetylglucosaminylphosphatidylinositol deacetylase n=1 Tax=Rhipicephalus sanguineus TaxID=34632 RepID=A0A9D4SXX9_RHISA|nr:N-acetylglucosaminyl-phosphatidylinositol de-N-acetylase [Rhipicephalus sanguineus]XP_037513845.1 N-acetylglucosaminyl-phosphatidylinositol de-N-acetylase [Rhipicephalus sanguineus]KAH7957771.1 hypothetical protein HPB52_022653 [Rhipicephalus sanguineus]
MEYGWWLSFTVFVVSVLLLFYLFVCNVCRLRTRKNIGAVGRVLLVIAHPDDECMFFGPTVLGLLQRKCELYLLCLSNGNYYRQGSERKEELRSSCLSLGIPSENLVIVQHSNMPDDPECMWNSNLVGRIVQKYVKCLGVDSVITFDQSGVSGHLNHIAVHKGVVGILKKELAPSGCRLFVLESVNKLRKYVGLLDVPLSYLLSEHAYVLPWSMVSLLKVALGKHKSQMLWFRHLYSCFSRYMVINTLSEVTVDQSKDN